MDTVQVAPEVIEGIKAFAAGVGRRITEADGGTDCRARRLLFGDFVDYISPKRVDDGWRELEGGDLFVAFVLSVSHSRDAHPGVFKEWTDPDTVRAAEMISVVLRQVEQVARLEGLEVDHRTAFILSAWAVLVGVARVR